MPDLLIKEGPGRGDRFTLAQAAISVGRDRENDIRLVDNTVSRFHARLYEGDGVWSISDLKSRNSTVLNGEAIEHQRELHHMDEIQLGSVVLIFLEDDATDMEALIREEEKDLEITETISVKRLRSLAKGRTSSKEALATANRRLVSLLKLAQAGGAFKSLPPLFDQITAALKDTLKPDRVIPILHQEDGTLLPYARKDSGVEHGLRGVGIGLSIVEHCRDKGEAVLSQGVKAGAGGTQQGAISSIICAPVRIGEKLLGVLYCDRVGGGEKFSKDDLHYLCLVSAQVAVAMENILSYERLSARARSLEREIQGQYDLVGASRQMKKVYRFISKAAPAESSVLICGESGTGKELVARAIHYNSPRRDGPFEAVNCAAMSPALIESELFGHVKGAFTGAVNDRPGRFELAHRGSLFLDEVVELPLECQTKLLRALEEGTIRRVGDVKERPVDVRVIAATNRDVDAAREKGQFRDDLYYRLDVLRVTLPPLAERGADIELLATHFFEEFRRTCKPSLQGITPEVLRSFNEYGWPGNVRELKNVIERMVIMSEGNVLGLELLPEDMKTLAAAPAGTTPEQAQELARSLKDVEKEHIRRVLCRVNGNKKRAAQILGLDRSTLYAKLKRYGIEY